MINSVSALNSFLLEVVLNYKIFVHIIFTCDDIALKNALLLSVMGNLHFCAVHTSELLQSEFLNEPRDSMEEREAAIELREQIDEEELLLEFLLLVQQRKQESANKLQDIVSFICSDIEEVSKQQAILRKKGGLGSFAELANDDLSGLNIPSLNIVDNDCSATMGSRKRFRPELQLHDLEECDDNLDDSQKHNLTGNEESSLFKSSRLMKNFKKLESAYFLTRCRPVKPSGRPLVRHSQLSSDGRTSKPLVNERSSINNLGSKEGYSEGRRSGWINPFLEGLCKYLSFSKLRVKADLNQGDLLNSSNLVCSLSFDRDGELFAAAGVNKKIKVFECDAIINENRDIHYPVVEMASRSKLSSICWNSYIKSQIASSNFEGVVQVGQVLHFIYFSALYCIILNKLLIIFRYGMFQEVKYLQK